MTRRYYIRQASGNVQGPFEVERIRAYIRAGRVRSTMKFSVDGVTWTPGRDITELFGQQAPEPASKTDRRPPRGRQGRGPRHRAPRRASFTVWWVVAGLLLITVTVVVVAARRGGEQQPQAGVDPELARAQEALDKVAWYRDRYRKRPPTNRKGFQVYIGHVEKLRAVGEPLLHEILNDYVDGPGADDTRARRLLDHLEFRREIPEEIAFRDYPYMHVVEHANRKRWFPPSEHNQHRAAEQAWKETLAHRERLRTDRKFRAVDRVRANIAVLSDFKDYNYATKWADPYLICYSTSQQFSEFDLLSIEDPDERERKRRELAAARRKHDAVLDETARLFQQFYGQFMQRFQDVLRLRPPMDPYAGRPDVGMFEDGLPLVVWIFSDPEAFKKHHVDRGKGPMEGVAGYFHPRNGWVYLFDEPKGDRQYVIDKYMHEAVHQLEYWFTRQRLRWSRFDTSQDFFSEGIAEWLGAVRVDPNGKLRLQAVNRYRLEGLQLADRAFRKLEQPLPWFTVRELTSFHTYTGVMQHAAEKWKLMPNVGMSIFYQQSWAFIYFLNEFANGRYRSAFVNYFGRVLDGATAGNMVRDLPLRKAFKIENDDDYVRLDSEFRQFYETHILRLDPDDFAYVPPPRGR